MIGFDHAIIGVAEMKVNFVAFAGLIAVLDTAFAGR